MGCVSAVPVPQPRGRSGAAARAAGAATGRRTLAAALLLGAAGAAVALLASGRIWAEGATATPGGTLSLSAEGGDITGVPSALAVVGLAALVAVFAVRRKGRTIVAALLTLSGAGAAVAAFLGASDRDALDEKAAETTGDTAATIGSLSHTPWPYVTAAAGLLILLAGLLALRYGSLWPAMAGRYERDGTPRARTAPVVDPDRPEDLWKALDRGEDPTDGDQAPPGR
ncbi:TIGR02234 family membrane protein [Streptomyces qinzhouensis]|uniref:TIGR02234 family membrane protein n=1 Tax=Streptomyces qinzhouensis TaxID=2599401 RepID=A0A5B8IGA9_9ACTN|nr:TIGR02234 family membrane protein [Streptomyces qinzhouensis]QDY76289.1 TIGR02234 family membrane protein [Streptomyces qinzhouensis]